MNKELEALKRIGVLEIKNNISFGYTVGYGGIVIASTKDYRTVAEAIKRNEPMKVIKEHKGYSCPKCNVSVFDEYNYCYDCGQALDWTDK